MGQAGPCGTTCGVTLIHVMMATMATEGYGAIHPLVCSLSPREKKESAKEALQVRDSSKDGEYWEALAHVIPELTLKLWDALVVALERY